MEPGFETNMEPDAHEDSALIQSPDPEPSEAVEYTYTKVEAGGEGATGATAPQLFGSSTPSAQMAGASAASAEASTGQRETAPALEAPHLTATQVSPDRGMLRLDVSSDSSPVGDEQSKLSAHTNSDSPPARAAGGPSHASSASPSAASPSATSGAESPKSPWLSAQEKKVLREQLLQLEMRGPSPHPMAAPPTLALFSRSSRASSPSNAALHTSGNPSRTSTRNFPAPVPSPHA